MPPSPPSIAVLEVKLEALTQRLEDRHTALLAQLELRDGALSDALERLQESLSPLASRVERVERFQTKLLGVVAAGTALLPVLGWVAERVIK